MKKSASPRASQRARKQRVMLPVEPSDVRKWTEDFRPPLSDEACVRVASLVDLLRFGPAGKRNRQGPKTPILGAMRTLLNAAATARQHWAAEAELGHLREEESAARIEWIDNLTTLLTPLRPDWLGENMISVEATERQSLARWLAEVIAAEMRAAGRLPSDGDGADMVVAVRAALESWGVVGPMDTVGAIARDLRRHRPPGGWGVGNSPPHILPREKSPEQP